MLKIVDEYKHIKGSVETNTSCLMDTKELVTVVIMTKKERYICYWDVDFLKFNYENNTVYVHNGRYNKPLKKSRIKKITIL